jgi:hypothetical protein
VKFVAALFCRGLCLYPKALTADKNGYTPMQRSRSTIVLIRSSAVIGGSSAAVAVAFLCAFVPCLPDVALAKSGVSRLCPEF